jgi:S-adenosylmethionine hydrolase
MPKPVMLLTDFGLADDFAGVCHGVIALRAPGAAVIHITHGIEPQFVLQGATVLRNTLPYMPMGVHLAVVDPGVGTSRRAVAVECADGRMFVGPDNGLLAPAIEASGGAVAAVRLESADHQLHPVSATFHGRDIFTPAAAHLAAGGSLGDLGPAVEVGGLATLEMPTASPSGNGLVASMFSADRFGNIALHLDEATLSDVVGEGGHVELQVRNDRYFARFVRTFGSVRPGDLLLYVDPYGIVSLAVNQGSAADMFRLRRGDQLRITPVHSSNGQSPEARVSAMTPRSR